MKKISVVVGIIKNDQQEILLALRQNNAFMSGFWELSGGKIETGETPEQALRREFKEELNINIVHNKHRINITHQYPDRIVDIMVFDILSYRGIACGYEGQKIAWVGLDKINHYQLLPTIARIIASINLPPLYWITPDKVKLSDIEDKLSQGIRQIQLRIKQAWTTEHQTLLVQAQALCRQYNAHLLLNRLVLDEQTDCHLHLNSSCLMKTNHRPIDDQYLLGVSAHNELELAQASKIQADFAVLSPILPTKTHLKAKPLGWQKAEALIKNAKLPVYCLGGLNRDDLAQAKSIGAVGIAGISQLD